MEKSPENKLGWNEHTGTIYAWPFPLLTEESSG